jgi:hypothetical protein
VNGYHLCARPDLWSYEDHGAGWQDAVRMAAVLDSLL